MKKIRGLGRGLNYSGQLIVVEGCDGSGKSTQLHLLRAWLESRGYPVFYTEWNSSELINSAIRRAKKKNLLTPTTFSLIHACDFADRYEKVILPPLRAGYIVLADRYVYTAYARDVARECDADWVRNIYSFAVRPTLAFYFQAPLDVSIQRILIGRPVLKYHEAGMDLGLHSDPVESFKVFQGRIKSEYDRMTQQEKLVVIDATQSIDAMQVKMRQIVQPKLKGYVSPQFSVPIRSANDPSWGDAIPNGSQEDDGDGGDTDDLEVRSVRPRLPESVAAGSKKGK